MNEAAPDSEFVLLAETGILERQALLACESLRRFGGTLASSLITVVSPRPNRRPSPETVARLQQMQVQYLPLALDSPTPQLGESYKPLALAWVESQPGPRTLVQVDSDTVFVAAPVELAAPDGAAARPVDAPNLCTTGPGHRLDHYWRKLCDRLQVDYEALPFVSTTIGGVSVRANFNGGLLAAPRRRAVFRTTAEFYRKVITENLYPPGREQLTLRTGAGIVSGPAARFFALTQPVFALACAAAGIRVAILPPHYNFPAHLLDQHEEALPSPLVHIHYHWLADNPGDLENTLLGDRLGLPADVRHWLRSRLPL